MMPTVKLDVLKLHMPIVLRNPKCIWCGGTELNLWCTEAC